VQLPSSVLLLCSVVSHFVTLSFFEHYGREVEDNEDVPTLLGLTSTRTIFGVSSAAADPESERMQYVDAEYCMRGFSGGCESHTSTYYLSNINTFGRHGGFDKIWQCLKMKKPKPSTLEVTHLLKIYSRVMDHLTEQVLGFHTHYFHSLTLTFKSALSGVRTSLTQQLKRLRNIC
jgi:hypothetical protein